jgi:hypothetical protein
MPPPRGLNSLLLVLLVVPAGVPRAHWLRAVSGSGVMVSVWQTFMYLACGWILARDCHIITTSVRLHSSACHVKV